MKALTIKQPWTQLIIEGIKDIENRTWKTNFRGRIYVHAGAFDPGEVYNYLNQEQRDLMLKKCPTLPKFHRGAIIGEVDIIDCVKNHSSIWAEKDVWHWVLANPVKYDEPILNIKGALSFWQPNIVKELT